MKLFFSDTEFCKFNKFNVGLHSINLQIVHTPIPHFPSSPSISSTIHAHRSFKSPHTWGKYPSKTEITENHAYK